MWLPFQGRRGASVGRQRPSVGRRQASLAIRLAFVGQHKACDVIDKASEGSPRLFVGRSKASLAGRHPNEALGFTVCARTHADYMKRRHLNACTSSRVKANHSPLLCFSSNLLCRYAGRIEGGPRPRSMQYPTASLCGQRLPYDHRYRNHLEHARVRGFAWGGSSTRIEVRARARGGGRARGSSRGNEYEHATARWRQQSSRFFSC